ncbi:DUF1295 domain-containing protein [Nocardia jejuensis]|uniref:DUF1295 domain-containing protein n=1 Tax=Nocardia jejuensis TaxID=328049 RepID=UPI000835B79A|nr:DUF1295 domain-containing protein [Nocardia jejuensis]
MNGYWGFLAIAVLSLLALGVLQLATFAIARRIGRYNIVDVTWGLGFAVVALVGAVFGGGALDRRLLLLAVVSVWAVRLSVHMHQKSAGHGEDPRYTELLERHGNTPGVALRRIFLTQGAAQWVISLPIQVSAIAGPTTSPGRYALTAGVLVWLVGVIFEAVGDLQLRRFRADPANRGTIMDRGLWAWTRHPNYFGDFCVWWGIWLIAASAWPGVLTVISPLLMAYVLIQGTGARLLERVMGERPGYREYQQRTSYFFPSPPRRTP